MGRPKIELFSDVNCSNKLNKVNDTFTYTIGAISHSNKKNIKVPIYIKNTGEYTAYNVVLSLVSKGFENLISTDKFNLQAGENVFIEFKISTNSSFVNGDSYEVRIDYDNC